MKRLLLIIPILSMILTACYREPIADAQINPNPAIAGNNITFTNYSTNTAYSEWNMGDGTAATSFNVVHYYIHPGQYTVTLNSYGEKKGVSRATFIVDVTGSVLKVVVQEIIEEYYIEEASVLLFASANDWYEADFDKAVGGEQFTDRYGECTFEGLSSQQYYVDVYYRPQNSNEGYVNWLLGEDDIGWVETQEVFGNEQVFIANVEAVTFDDQKKSTGRPAVRPPLKEVHSIHKGAVSRTPKENKISTPVERN